jgi:hypothetical protein
MKKNTLGALVVLAVLVLGWWLLRGSKMKMPPQAAPASEKSVEPAAAPPPEDEKPAPQSTSVAPPVSGGEIPNAQQLKWQEMMHQLDQTPMDLFGIVVDEKNQPGAWRYGANIVEPASGRHRGRPFDNRLRW